MSKNKLHVVLDLDCTLICSLCADVEAENYILENVIQKNHSITIHTNEYCTSMHTMERPGLYQFLTQLREFADISVFTARPADSALIAVNFIDPHREFINTIYTQENMTCFDLEEGMIQVKDFDSAFGVGEWDPKRTVLVDDVWNSYGCKQPCNFLPVVPWGFDSFLWKKSICLEKYGKRIDAAIDTFVDDQHLLQDLLPLLKQLDLLEDIRPVIVNMQACPEYTAQLMGMVFKVESHLAAVKKYNHDLAYFQYMKWALEHYQTYQAQCSYPPGFFDECESEPESEPELEQEEKPVIV